MDILSDVNVVGKIKSNELCAATIRGINFGAQIVSFSSLYSSDTKITLENGGRAFFCAQSYFYGGIVDDNNDSSKHFYVKKHVIAMDVPANCNRFLIFCGCQNDNTYPMIQAVDSSTKKVINLDYEFETNLVETKVFGGMTSGNCARTIHFNLLLS